MNKNIKCFLIVLIVSIILFFLIQLVYKTIQTGNNISKSSDDLIEDILNISSYESKLEVTINSNKTTNKYVLEQYYFKPNYFKQIVKEPANIEGLEIIYDGNKLEIKNTNLGLSKIYENYTYLNENLLWLSSFIESCNSNKYTIEETQDEIILNIKIQQSKGKLYINNCQFYKNEAYGVGNDICVGDGGTVIYNKMIVTPECHPKEVCFAQSLSATKSKLITGLCMGGSFLVGLGVGIFTANPALGLLAGAGAGALLGSLGAGVIIAKNYDINFSRTKTCLILIGGSVGAGALGGVIGGCVGLALKPAPATPEQIIEYMYGKETAIQDFLYV